MPRPSHRREVERSPGGSRFSPGTRRSIRFAVLSMMVCAIVNPGNFGTIDTTRRLQVERWIRLGEPPVSPTGTSEFGVIGRNGVRHAWYGIGQSLVLAPFDLVVSATAVPILSRAGLNAEKQRQVVELLIAFLMQSSITTCLLAMAYAVLTLFDFAPQVSLAGALALLFATSCLQYVQSAQENNLLLLLTLCSLYCIRRWHRGDGAGWAAAAGLSCGFAVLVRLPSMLETAALLVFALSARKRFLVAFLPPVLAGLFLDRLYHWVRFGELFSTYTTFIARQRPLSAPAGYPFSYPFWKGFSGTLFSPDKSIFLFDPLLIVLLAIAVWKWSHISRPVRRLLLCGAGLLFLYAGFYATYYDFGGDVAWGHRFLTLPVALLCLFAVPLFLSLKASLPRLVRRLVWSTIGASIALQILSTALAPNLEVRQREAGYDNGVIVNRAVNLTQAVLHRENGNRFAGIPPEWRTLYYLPFQLRFRFPLLADWAMGAWLAGVVCLVYLVVVTLRRPELV